MTPFLIALTQAIYTARRGTVWPKRVELSPDLHARFQEEAHSELQAMQIDAILIGSMAGVPIVKRECPGALVVRQDGSMAPIAVPP